MCRAQTPVAKAAAAAAALPAFVAAHPALALVSLCLPLSTRLSITVPVLLLCYVTTHDDKIFFRNQCLESLCSQDCLCCAAQVDDRLGGEGTGKILGIGSGEQWAILGVFTLIWALYYAAGRDLGGDKGDDSGLTL